MTELEPVLYEADFGTGAVVRPGDTLVVGLHTNTMTPAQYDLMRRRLEDALPGVKVVFITQVQTMTIYRPDQEDLNYVP